MKLKFWRPPFFVSSEERVFQLISKFLDSVIKSVSELDAAIGALIAKDSGAVKKAVDAVSIAEQDADDVRRSIERAIFEGRFFDRGEKIDLMEKIDDVADYAETAAQTIMFKELASLPEEIASLLAEMTAATKKTVISLRHAMASLYTNFSAVSNYVKMIEDERDKVRETYGKLIRQVYTSRLSPVTMMILRDLSFRISRVADNAEEAGDRIDFLAVKYG